MRNKKTIALICAVSVAALIALAAGKVFSDNTGAPFSANPASNIQTWYDETWQASGFYRLEASGPVNGNFFYRYTDTPTTTTAPVWVSMFGEAFIPQDMVVTEWRVTGHVHFSSDI